MAGEQPFDVMHIGPASESVLTRLEAARVWLCVPELYNDIEAAKAQIAASPWPGLRQSWEAALPGLFASAGLAEIPEWAPRTATPEIRFWATAARWNVLRARQALQRQEWKAFLAVGRRAQERDRYRVLAGRLASMESIRDEVRARGIADDADVEIKSTFYKHRTRRFQAVNVWPPEASSGQELVVALTPQEGEAVARLARLFYGSTRTDVPSRTVVPQRIRWFRALDPMLDAPHRAARGEAGLVDLCGLDVSGSQAQILAVVMGLRDLEDQLHHTPFKKLVALSIRALQQRRKIQASRELLENDTWLENVAKGAGMPGLYGGRPSNIAAELCRDPERYGPGLSTAGVEALFRHDPTLTRLLEFLPICEALGRAAAAGVTVEDPLDGVSFTWNPPKRTKITVSSGAFKLYVYEPNRGIVDQPKLVRRIAPGLIHMLDALYASIVVVFLNQQGVRDVVAIHDAFLVPHTAWYALMHAIEAAGREWLPLLRPFYDVFERYLPASTREGRVVRQWRERWEKRRVDCEAGRDTWPDFRTKHEGAEFR